MKGQLAEPLRRLAAEGIYLGTSSWKYEGWLGQIYDRERYSYRGKFAEKRFQESCLEEYAETFKTVCFDGAYYQFPSATQLAKLFDQVPQDFRLSFKVTDAVTLKKFPNLPRCGPKAGQPNADYLNADLFDLAFLRGLAPYQARVGVLMFEFSHFYPSDYREAGHFVADLDAFLSNLPKGWSYGVEIRNREFLQPEYFAVLRRHGVSHVFNSWTAMPPVGEQLELPHAQTSDRFVAARFLLKPGRSFETAVKQFAPYDGIKEVYQGARDSALALIKQARERKQKAYVYVNNRLEGSAMETIVSLASST